MHTADGRSGAYTAVTSHQSPIKPLDHLSPITDHQSPIRPLDHLSPVTYHQSPIKPLDHLSPITSHQSPIRPLDHLSPITSHQSPIKPLDHLSPASPRNRCYAAAACGTRRRRRCPEGQRRGWSQCQTREDRTSKPATSTSTVRTSQQGCEGWHPRGHQAIAGGAAPPSRHTRMTSV